MEIIINDTDSPGFLNSETRQFDMSNVTKLIVRNPRRPGDQYVITDESGQLKIEPDIPRECYINYNKSTSSHLPVQWIKFI